MNTAAKKYLSQGLIVFPVGLGYKQTADGKLKKDLQPEPGFTGLTLETARRLSFAKNGLGLLTGFGVMALDIDNVALWDHVLTTLGVPEPETCRSISQSGGRHLLFKVTPELERLRKKSVFGLKALGLDDFDLLGKGDFLLVPPSSFETPNGHREYTFVPGYSLVDNPGTLLPAPGWLIEVLTPNSALHRHVRESYLRLAFKKVDSDLDSGDTVDPDKVDSDSGVCKGEKDSVSDDFTPAEKALIDLDTEDRLKEVAKHVKKLSANRAIDRQSWIEVGMAIHHATDGHYQGMELWDQFSRRAGPYDRHTLEYQWGSFQNGSGITLGSLIHWAKEDTRVAREEKKRLKSEEEKEQEKMKADEALRREAVQFGVNHTGGEGVFEGWNAEKSVAVISNTMHHPDHRVECVVGSNGAYQKCTECAWRNPISGQLMVPRIEYPALHQQFFNITINNTVNYYNSNSVELELWDDEAHLADDYQPFDDPKLSLHFKRAFSGIDSDFGRFVYHLNFGTVVASGEDKTQWFKLNGFRWEQVGVDRIKDLMDPDAEGRLLHAKLQEARKWYLNNKNPKLADRIFKVKNNVKTDAFIDRVIRRTCARLFSKGYKALVENLDKNKDILGFNNGVYDLEQGLFREGRADDYISKSVGYDYVPGCKEHRAELEDFFAKLFPDDELRDYVLRYLASCLSGKTGDQLIFFGHGSGRNGKSKLLALMKETLGPDYASTTDKGVVIGQQRPDANAVTHALNMLKGKRFAYISETVEGSKINESAFKALSGEDCVFTRELYKAGSELEPEFKLFMVCNHLPKFNAGDGAMERRIRVIPFQSQFVHPEELVRNIRPNVFKVDTSLDSRKLQSWRMSFMGLLLDYFPKYKQHGIAAKPTLVAAMTKGYLSDNDAYRGFIHACYDPVPIEDETGWIPGAEFYQKFKTWCHENGFDEHARLHNNMVAKKFTGLVDRLNMNKAAFKGIHIRGLRFKV